FRLMVNGVRKAEFVSSGLLRDKRPRQECEKKATFQAGKLQVIGKTERSIAMERGAPEVAGLKVLKVKIVLMEADDILKSELSACGPVAQLVEHCTFNAVVAGSSPARLTRRL